MNKRTVLAVVVSLLMATPAAAFQGRRTYEVADVPDGATLSGQVTFTGRTPNPSRLLITRDMEICGEGFRERREVDVAESGGLRAVVVTIEGVASGRPWADRPDGYAVDQKDCFFTPYIQVMPWGTDFDVINSDPVLHNIHGYEMMNGGRRTMFNLGQPEMDTISAMLRTRRGRVVGLECDAHDFMLGWIYAADSPYHVIVDEDGRFEIEGIPPGTYTVRAWHPRLGTQERELTFEPGGAAETEFVFARD